MVAIADHKSKEVVAEVSKGWCDGVELIEGSGMLSRQFEICIAANRSRGYVLHSWRMTAVGREHEGHYFLNETIVAVFRLSEL